jgi:hypothetical protein
MKLQMVKNFYLTDEKIYLDTYYFIFWVFSFMKVSCTIQDILKYNMKYIQTLSKEL